MHLYSSIKCGPSAALNYDCAAVIITRVKYRLVQFQPESAPEFKTASMRGCEWPVRQETASSSSAWHSRLNTAIPRHTMYGSLPFGENNNVVLRAAKNRMHFKSDVYIAGCARL